MDEWGIELESRLDQCFLRIEEVAQGLHCTNEESFFKSIQERTAMAMKDFQDTVLHDVQRHATAYEEHQKMAFSKLDNHVQEAEQYLRHQWKACFEP